MISDSAFHFPVSLPSLPIAILLLLCLVVFLLFLKRFIFCKKRSLNLRLYYEDNLFNQEVISLIPQFSRNYTPPCWVRNKVVSTLIFGVFGRFGSKQTDPVAERHRVGLADGTHIAIDLFLESTGADPLLDNVMFVIIPGVSNHSQSDYIRAYIEYASSQGFKVACLNQLGSACGEKLNPDVPRIHTYGGTGDLSAMVDYLREKYPDMKYIGVGFSLGANILLKYLGERPERQSYFLCAQSWCQGYDVATCLPHMNRRWSGGKFFTRLLTKKKKAEVSNMLNVLFGGKPSGTAQQSSSTMEITEYDKTPEDESKPLMSGLKVDTGDIQVADSLLQPLEQPHTPTQHSEAERHLPSWVPTYAYQKVGRDVWVEDPPRDANGYLIEGWEHVPPFDVNEFNRAIDIGSIDASFVRPFLGFRTRDDFYRWSASLHVMDQIRDIPILLINARDDPMIPWRVAEDIMNNHCMVNRNAIGVITKHGGHLGFFEGSCFARNRVSWVDRVSILHARSVAQIRSGDYTDRL